MRIANLIILPLIKSSWFDHDTEQSERGIFHRVSRQKSFVLIVAVRFGLGSRSFCRKYQQYGVVHSNPPGMHTGKQTGICNVLFFSQISSSAMPANTIQSSES